MGQSGWGRAGSFTQRHIHSQMESVLPQGQLLTSRLTAAWRSYCPFLHNVLEKKCGWPLSMFMQSKVSEPSSHLLLVWLPHKKAECWLSNPIFLIQSQKWLWETLFTLPLSRSPSFLNQIGRPERNIAQSMNCANPQALLCLHIQALEWSACLCLAPLPVLMCLGVIFPLSSISDPLGVRVAVVLGCLETEEVTTFESGDDVFSLPWHLPFAVWWVSLQAQCPWEWMSPDLPFSALILVSWLWPVAEICGRDTAARRYLPYLPSDCGDLGFLTLYIFFSFIQNKTIFSTLKKKKAKHFVPF